MIGMRCAHCKMYGKYSEITAATATVFFLAVYRLDKVFTGCFSANAGNNWLGG